MKVALRRIGNAMGVVIPRSVLAEAGLISEAEMALEGGAVVPRRPAAPVRSGWVGAAKKIAAHDDDALVMGEFANADDAGNIWSRIARSTR